MTISIARRLARLEARQQRAQAERPAVQAPGETTDAFLTRLAEMDPAPRMVVLSFGASPTELHAAGALGHRNGCFVIAAPPAGLDEIEAWHRHTQRHQAALTAGRLAEAAEIALESPLRRGLTGPG